MKGILLAGGNGMRLRPITSITNKHLLPIYNDLMVMYPLNTLKTLGIKDILIVSGGEHIGDFTEYLGDGSDFGINLTYRVQKGAGGIADALKQAENFAAGDPVTVILGDNVFDNGKIFSMPLKLDHAYLYTKKVEHPERFGVVSMSEPRREGLPMIVEKPKAFVGNQAVLGLYVYPNDVFGILPFLLPSARGELEITDLNNHYVLEDRAELIEFRGFWSDAGTFDSLLECSNWAKKQSLLDK